MSFTAVSAVKATWNQGKALEHWEDDFRYYPSGIIEKIAPKGEEETSDETDKAETEEKHVDVRV